MIQKVSKLGFKFQDGSQLHISGEAIDMFWWDIAVRSRVSMTCRRVKPSYVCRELCIKIKKEAVTAELEVRRDIISIAASFVEETGKTTEWYSVLWVPDLHGNRFQSLHKDSKGPLYIAISPERTVGDILKEKVFTLGQSG